MLSKLKKLKKRFLAKKYIIKHEHVFRDEVRYMYVDKKTDALLIVFSAFTGEKRLYNYFSQFSKLSISQLYILDTWAEKGSYYWFENGENRPEMLVSDLISSLCHNHGIKNIVTAGTSKGGSAAIYFGLKHDATDIFSGACQYRIGTYLYREKHRDIFFSMMGNQDIDNSINRLNEKIENMIIEKQKEHGLIHLFYSRCELTYERQIVPLINDLKKYKYQFEEEICDFPKHDDVGLFFPSYLIHELDCFK